MIINNKKTIFALCSLMALGCMLNAKLVPDKPNKTNCVLISKKLQRNIISRIAFATIVSQSIQRTKGNITMPGVKSLYLTFLGTFK